MILLETIRKDGRSSQEGITESAVHGVNRYEAFLREMKGGWFLEKARGIICETDMDFIRTSHIRKGIVGTILELRCPQSKAVSIFGKNQIECQTENEPHGFNTNPYFFTVRCFDGCDRELDPGCRINIKKVSVHGGISRAWRASYGDLSPATFPDGIYLWHGEILALEVLNPDIDIERVKFSVEADVFQASK